MVDPGLDNRLRQHTRRSGLVVGLSMALTIAICIGASTLIYARLVPLLSDLVPIEAPVAPPVEQSDSGPAPSDQGQGVAQNAAEPTPPPANPEPTAIPADAAPTEAPAVAAAVSTPEAFTPDYQISADQSVNFRAGPSRNDPILVTLPPATPLQYLGEDSPASDPTDAPRWMKFKVADGSVGWVRQIDTEPYKP